MIPNINIYSSGISKNFIDIALTFENVEKTMGVLEINEEIVKVCVLLHKSLF